MVGPLPWASALLASVSTVAPLALQRAEPATYTMPAGSGSRNCTALAALLPLLL